MNYKTRERLTAEEERDLLAHRNDPAARKKLIESHMQLATWCAAKFAGQMDIEDLVQEAMCALIHAIDKFDADRGARLSTYAVTVIRRHLQKKCHADGLIYYPISQTRKVQIQSGDAQLCDDTDDTLFDTIAASDDERRRAREYAAVQYALSRLTEREQAILRYAYLDNSLSADDISRELGISTTMIHVLKYDALRKLRNPDTIDALRHILGDVS